MAHVLRSKLPAYMVDHIKLYTGEGAWRNGKYINIHRIPLNDPRYEMLRKRPKIKQVHNGDYSHPIKGCTWFKFPNGKFVVINVGYLHNWNGLGYINGYFWQMHYNQEQFDMYIG
jgi:hypothetical protein